MRGARGLCLLAPLMVAAACATAADPEASGSPLPPAEAGDAVPAQPPVSEPAPIEAARAPAALPYARGVDVVHYDFEVGVSDVADWTAGRARIRVAVTAPSPTLPLDFTGLAVDEVRVAGAPVTIDHRDGVLRVPLSGTAGDTASVEVTWRGTPDDALFLGENVNGARAAFADDWPNRARFWIPTVDHPSDKATVRFTVHAPAAWKVVANGRLEGEPTRTPASARGPEAAGGVRGAGRRTWVWQTTVPIPTYTMVLGAADMVVRSVGRAACGQAPASAEADGCVDVTWWAFPEDTANAARVFARAADMVDHYTGLLGPFPYEKLANVQSATRFGGMENASAIFYTGGGLAGGNLGEGTVAHEIAHQWFGDSVTEAEWAHLWLSEGFATYFGAQYFEQAEGPEDFRQRLEGARRTYLDSDVTGVPVIHHYDNLYDLLNANSYQKGGWILHMLRGLLGDEAFFAGVHAYYASFEHGNALSEDFQHVMEDASGQELGWFFDQWLRQPGYPVFDVTHRWIPGRSGAGEVEVTVRQVQDAAWPRFRVPLEVALRGDGGLDARSTVVVEGATTVVRMSAPRRPTEVVLDPDGWVLKGDAR